MSWTSADTPFFADSSLLGQLPPFSSHRGANTGADVSDLSLSELYISDCSDTVEHARERPFSLLPPRADEATTPQDIVDEASVFNGCGVQAETPDDTDGMTIEKETRSENEARTREERLQHDLFLLRKLNTTFSLYNNALKDARSSTENVSMQLERTDRLLNQYVNLLQNTEKNSKLIFDETWQGGSNDLEELERIRAESASKAAREREERERLAQLEQQRRMKEEQERKIREEREAKELLKKASMPVRGVRVTRGRVGTVRDASQSRERPPVSASTTGIPNRRGGSGIPSRGSLISRGRRL